MRRNNVGTRKKNPLARVGAIGALVGLLFAFTAAPVFGHHVVSIGCAEDDIKVVANIGDGHRIIVDIDGTVEKDDEITGAVVDHTYTFPYGGGPAHVEVTLYNPGDGPGDDPEDFMEADVNCYTPPPPNAPELSFSDCEQIGAEGGSITVEGLDEDVFLQINGPTVLTITADGTYPLAPGHYGFRAVFDGKPIDSGTFDIGDCPEGEFSALAAPCSPTSNVTAIRFFGLLLALHVYVDGAPVTPDGDGDVVVTPGLHDWEIRAANNVTVLASGEDLLVPTCQEGDTGGSTGTPAASLPNSAVASPSAGAPIATLAFGLLLMSSLGALAFVNVRSTRRR